MEQTYKKHCKFENKLVISGFGCIAQAIITLIFRHIDIKPEQVTIITRKEDGADLAKKLGVNFIVTALTKENYQTVLNDMAEGDFLLNLSVDVSSGDLIKFCQQKGALYLDTCIEPWAGGYVDHNVSTAMRSNYAMREALLALRKDQKQSTALVAHGANPGLVSHFVKQALMNIATDTGVNVSVPNTQKHWAELARKLDIKVIHIAERDTQIANKSKQPGEFVNTWSIDGFVAEGCQPAELGWGTHEVHWPFDGHHHDFGSQCAIYLNRPGATTRVRTWTPLSGAFHGYLITHTEAISISNYFTLKDEDDVLHYRPTVHFAYHPCEDAVLSVHEFVSKEWQQQKHQRILFNEITDGMDELGVLLMGNAKGAYWFGSQLTIHQARELAPYNNATSLQVSIGALSGMIWVMQNPQRGIVEPDEIDFKFILNIATPYLGNVGGHYTDWTPLKERQQLFPEKIDHSDPWQFINMLVK